MLSSLFSLDIKSLKIFCLSLHDRRVHFHQFKSRSWQWPHKHICKILRSYLHNHGPYQGGQYVTMEISIWWVTSHEPTHIWHLTPLPTQNINVMSLWIILIIYCSHRSYPPNGGLPIPDLKSHNPPPTISHPNIVNSLLKVQVVNTRFHPGK